METGKFTQCDLIDNLGSSMLLNNKLTFLGKTLSSISNILRIIYTFCSNFFFFMPTVIIEFHSIITRERPGLLFRNNRSRVVFKKKNSLIFKF